MSEYITQAGDNFNRLSRRFYGDESDIDLLRDSNPGVEEPFSEGISLVIPDKNDFPGVSQAEDEDEIQIFINGKLFKFWTTYKITQHIDSFSVIEFAAPFNPDVVDQRDFFRPFQYQLIKIIIGDDLQFLGVMLPPLPDSTVDSVTVTVAAYSKAAVLNDCNFSGQNLSKLSLNDRNLEEIAGLLCETLGLSPVFVDDSGPVFEEIQLEPDENPFEFLAGLAKQRNLVISDNEKGQPVFWRSIAENEPVAIFEGDSPVRGLKPNFNGQAYYSHITALSAVDSGFDGSKYTIKNDKLKGSFRPLVFKAPDTEGGDTKTAAEAKLSRMLANAVSYNLPLTTWRDPSGELWKPNSYVAVTSPKNMIYKRYLFLIRSVELLKSSDGKTAALTLVLPGAFAGTIPGVMPWDE